jgi:hypothetical protein
MLPPFVLRTVRACAGPAVLLALSTLGGEAVAQSPVIPKIALTELVWARGKPAVASAVLLTPDKVPIGGATVKFSVDNVLKCTSTTDAKGRAFCAFVTAATPANLVSHKLTALYEKTDAYWGAMVDSTVRLGGVRSGSLSFPGGPTIVIDDLDGVIGRTTVLRAVVKRPDGTAYAGRKVRFATGNMLLGYATTNAAGIAKVSWKPQQNHLGAGFSRWDTGALGAVQAWLEPAAGSDWPASSLARAMVSNTDPNRYSPCSPTKMKPYVSQRGITYPTKCTAQLWESPSFDVANSAQIIVRRSAFGAATVVTKASFTGAIAQPATPPPNADCNPSLPSGAAFCSRACARTEYLIMAANGTVGQLLGKTPAQCGWTLQASVAPSAQDFRDAHDACNVRAHELGKPNAWNHSVTLPFDVRVYGHFQFRDPHTVGTNSSYEASLLMEHVFRERKGQLPVTVLCRE